MPEGEISIDDPRAEEVRELLERHLAFAKSCSPPEDVHALELDGLLDPAVTVCSFRLDGELLAVGALKRLDARHAELKSMHTAESARGRGIGRAMVEHLLAVARDRGFRQVSLETGSMPAFCAGTAALRQRGLQAVRTVRRLPLESQQHLHDAVAQRPGRHGLRPRVTPG